MGGGPILRTDRFVWSAALALVAGGCVTRFPEAALPADEPLDRTTARIESALGLGYLTEPVRVQRTPQEVTAIRAASPLAQGVPTPLDEECYGLFRPADVPVPPAGAARDGAWSRPGVAYDPRSGVVVAAAGAVPGRPFDLARTEAFALALLDQHVPIERTLEDLRDRPDRRAALLGLAAGAAHAATLEASIAPVFMFDASAAPLRRLHGRLTERLLADPDGAPAELLAEVDLPEVERVALERLLETSGVARRKAILEVFAGARLVLEAKDRVSSGNLSRVFFDPPRSTEHLLHPERYLEHGDPPVLIQAGARAGLLGPGFAVLETATAGEFGLRLALEGPLGPVVAAAAAEGWGGDLLTVYRMRGTEQRAFAWHIEFDDRFQAQTAAAALERAVIARIGGHFVEAVDGIRYLADGAPSVSIRRDRAKVALLVADAPQKVHRAAVLRMLREETKLAREDAKTVRHDRGYRLLRAVASPIFYDRPGRFDSLFEGLFGLAFRHRVYPTGADHAFFNLSAIPVLGSYLPEESFSRVLFGIERSGHRCDTALLLSLVRKFSDLAVGATRFWCPLFSYRNGPEFRSLAVLYGFLFEKSSGAGFSELSPRPLYSRWTGLDGAEGGTGILFDAVNWQHRDGRYRRFRLLPYGLLAEVTASDAPDGVDVGLLLGGIRVRSQTVLPETGHFDFSLLQGYGLRFFRDQASGNYEWSLLGGLLGGVEGGPRRASGGILRILGRSFLGGGHEAGQSYFDFLFLRFGG